MPLNGDIVELPRLLFVDKGYRPASHRKKVFNFVSNSSKHEALSAAVSSAA